MTRRGAFAELRDFLDLVYGAGLTRYSSPVVEVPARLNDNQVVAVTTARHTGSHTGPLGINDEEERDFFFSPGNFAASFRAGDYAVVLRDGAMLQIRYDFDGDELVGHRLCYFPLPCDIPLDYLDEFTPADVIEMVLEQEPHRVRLRSPLRFDYSAYDTSEDPTVHMHLLTDDGRLPVFGPLSLGHFVTLVFRTFYRSEWDNHDFLREYTPQLFWRTIIEEQERSLHLSCRH